MPCAVPASPVCYTSPSDPPRRLPLRLLRVADAVGCCPGSVHADIGSDHALLPCHLLASGQVARVVAVEKYPGPLKRSRRNLAPFVAAGRAEVRAGDGFSALLPGEADSASLCGLGASRIARLLDAHPERLPERLVLQSVDDPAPLRHWARAGGFHLLGETTVPGERFCAVLNLSRRGGPDPAYARCRDAAALGLALEFGPWLLAAQDPNLAAELGRQRVWLKRALARRDAPAFRDKLRRVEAALKYL